MRVMKKGLLAALLTLILARGAWSDSWTAAVVDPQDRAVQGAEVTLRCGGQTRKTHSNAGGQFTISLPAAPASCSISITYPGFAQYELSFSKAPLPPVIHLKLAATKQSVNVALQTKKPGPPSRAAVASASVSHGELRKVSNNTEEQIEYAKEVSGTTFERERTYVDGMPTNTPPPAEVISAITVNADPFSAEFSDGDQTHLEITSKTPDRKVRFHLGGASLGLGGNSVLGSGLHSSSHYGSWGVSGPIPRLPLTFILNLKVISDSHDEPILAPTIQNPNGVPAENPAAVSIKNHSGSLLIGTYYSKSDVIHASITFLDTRLTGANVNAGGLTLPESGFDSSVTAREVRGMFARTDPRYDYRSSVVYDKTDAQSGANTSALGVVVLGALVSGGAVYASNTTGQSRWTWKNVISSTRSGHPWVAGLTLSHSGEGDSVIPNPHGVIRFSNLQALSDAELGFKTGTWFLERGNGRVDYSSTTLSPFFQMDLIHSAHSVVTGGVRGDYQTKSNLLISPRLSAATERHGFILRAGAGMFVEDWSNKIFLIPEEYDGFHLTQSILQDESLLDVGTFPANAPFVLSQISPNLARPRYWLTKVSVEHPIGKLVPAFEYTYDAGTHLLGSRRLQTGYGWQDLLESNRDLRRHRLHARLGYEWKGQALVAHYEWIHSRDNTDGPFSYPEFQNNLRAEWARSSGVSPNNFTLVGIFKLPRAVSLTLVEAARGSVPFNVISGKDLGGDGLFNDRAGLERNSGDGPSYHSLSLYGFRRIPLPAFLVRSKDKVYIDAGVRVDNLLNNKNYLAFGPVLGSPLFGKPLAALPGHSFRVWFSFDQ
jgi:Carboxypeptidase regulatory-like domain